LSDTAVLGELLKEFPTAISAEEATRLKARNLLTRTSSFSDFTFLPVDLDVLASIQGITIERKRLPLSQSGRLTVQEGRVVAVVNAAHPLSRQRFTIGHEIGHSLFPGFRKIHSAMTWRRTHIGAGKPSQVSQMK